MAQRLQSKWHKEKQRPPAEIAGALGFIIWKISTNVLLELENQGFMTYSNDHRLQVMAEILAFMVQCTDRLVYGQMTEDERQIFIVALANHLTQSFAENKTDLFGKGDYKTSFIQFLNRRADEYAELTFIEKQPQIDFLRHFGKTVSAVIGDNSNRHWVEQFIMEIQAPDALTSMKKTLHNLFSTTA
jgi:hypothetical protein